MSTAACMARCSATVLKDNNKAGEYEKEGYGQRLYTNWESVMFSTEGEVSAVTMAVPHCCVFTLICWDCCFPVHALNCKAVYDVLPAGL